MDEIKYIKINKNRGWRGLAEVVCITKDRDIAHKMVFSFSQAVWADMLDGRIVVQDTESYYVIYFDKYAYGLPSPTQQRSVLIKSFESTVTKVNKYDKKSWMADVTTDDYAAIVHFTKNNNNHTTSDWNYIGIRVVPTI